MRKRRETLSAPKVDLQCLNHSLKILINWLTEVVEMTKSSPLVPKFARYQRQLADTAFHEVGWGNVHNNVGEEKLFYPLRFCDWA